MIKLIATLILVAGAGLGLWQANKTEVLKLDLPVEKEIVEEKVEVNKAVGAPAGSEIDTVLNDIAVFQQEYIKTHSMYWQGKITDTRVPKDGNRLVPNNLDAKVYYQDKKWRDFSAFTDLPWQIEIYQYKQWDGKIGYQVFFRKEELGKTYEKSVGYGAQGVQKTYDWRILSKSPL